MTDDKQNAVSFAQAARDAADYISVAVDMPPPGFGRVAPDSRARQLPRELRALAALLEEAEQNSDG